MAFQQINGKQIKPGAISDAHINNKLTESVLDINWSSSSHAQSLLKNKVILDYVQLTDPVSFTSGSATATINLALDDNATGAVPGVVVGQAVRFRTSVGDPLIDPNGKEVVGKITAKVGPGAGGGFDYTVTLYNNDGVTPYPVDTAKTVELLYAIRTTLWDASENFASNERFIDGAVDIRSKLDLSQLAKDIFGTGYVFNQDGAATLATSLNDLLTKRTVGSTETTKTITATNIIDEVYTARGGKIDLATRLTDIANTASTAVTNLTNNLASTDAGKGASLVGVQDADGNFTSSNVEGVLKELADADAGINTELTDARGNKTSLAGRLDVSLDDDGKLVDSRLHVHGTFAFTLAADSATVNFDALSTPKINSATLADGTDELEVYVNGSLQAESFHYALTIVDGKIAGIDFTPDTIKAADDVIIIKWSKYSV